MQRSSTVIVAFLGWASLVWPLVDQSFATDWRMQGRDGSRNAVSPDQGAPWEWSPGVLNATTGLRENSLNVLWGAKLGDQTFSSPVVSDGLIWIGTNAPLEDPGHAGAYARDSVLKCFRTKDGKLVYEYRSPTLETKLRNIGHSSLGSSPLIEGSRLWFVTNRGEVICLDIGPLLRNEGRPQELWKVDLVDRFGINLFQPVMGPPIACSIGPSWNGRLFITVPNGVDDSRQKVPKPEAPSVLCLDQQTGDVYWKDNSPGANVLVAQFASPTVANIDGAIQVIVPQGDGWVRSFDPMTGDVLWEFDVNFKTSRHSSRWDSEWNSLLGNAVVYENRVYVVSGRDGELLRRPARLVCIDPRRRGDVSSELAVDANDRPLPRRRLQGVDVNAGEKAIPNPNSALLWEFAKDPDNVLANSMHGTPGSVVVAKNLVVTADSAGLVNCFDATTGKRHWSYNSRATVWASPMVVEDAVYVADQQGDVSIYGLSSDPAAAFRRSNSANAPRARIPMETPITAAPVFVDGVLYIATRSTLFAITANQERRSANATGGFWPQWRGADRDNISNSAGLLQEWPESGPPLIWRLKGLGDGVSPMSIGDGRLFSIGLFGTMEYIRCLDEKTGESLWYAELGRTLPQSRVMRWYTQRSPTLEGGLLYAVSLTGELICFRAADGKEVWRRSYVSDFSGRHHVYGFCDCPVVYQDRLICTPGGSEATIVALHKESGKIAWTCSLPDAGSTTYSKGVLATISGERQFVACLENAVAGVSAQTGQVRWRFNRAEPSHTSHSPIVLGSSILCFDGFNRSLTCLEVHRENGVDPVEKLFERNSIPVGRWQDDTICLGDRIYEHGQGVFACFDIKTGATLWTNRTGPLTAMSYANERFYFHTSDGEVALVEGTSSGPVMKGKFVLPDHEDSFGTTRPIVTAGRLYVREDDQLFCFDVSATSRRPATDSHTVVLKAPQARSAESGSDTRTLRSIYVPTPMWVVEKMLELAKVKASDVVYDLGSGDGRIVIHASRKYGSHAVGFELDKELVQTSRLAAAEAGVAQLAQFELRDLFEADLSKADVVAVYLLPAQLEKMLPQLAAMKPGSRLVSHQFEIPGVPAEQTIRLKSEDGEMHTIHLWTLPLRKSR